MCFPRQECWPVNSLNIVWSNTSIMKSHSCLVFGNIFFNQYSSHWWSMILEWKCWWRIYQPPSTRLSHWYQLEWKIVLCNHIVPGLQNRTLDISTPGHVKKQQQKYKHIHSTKPKKTNSLESKSIQRNDYKIYYYNSSLCSGQSSDWSRPLINIRCDMHTPCCHLRPTSDLNWSSVFSCVFTYSSECNHYLKHFIISVSLITSFLT